MKLQKLLGALIIFSAGVLCGCATANIEEEADALAEQIQLEANQLNHCSSDSDCVELEITGQCKFGLFLVNKSEDTEQLESLSKQYGYLTQPPGQSCLYSRAATRLICVETKCDYELIK